MSPSTLTDLAQRVDDLLRRPWYGATARALVDAYLEGRREGNVDAIPFPPSGEEYDFPELYEDAALTPPQRAAAMVALLDIQRFGVEKIIPYNLDDITTTPKAADGHLSDADKRVVAWDATLRNVRAVGEYARPWFARQLTRFEEDLRGAGPRQEGPPAAPEATDTIPYTSPLSAKDLARMLRARGYSRATDNAVEIFLRRHRAVCPDCYEQRDQDDRRRNQAKFMHQPEVWPALVQHFSPPRQRRLTDDN